MLNHYLKLYTDLNSAFSRLRQVFRPDGRSAILTPRTSLTISIPWQRNPVGSLHQALIRRRSSFTWPTTIADPPVGLMVQVMVKGKSAAATFLSNIRTAGGPAAGKSQKLLGPRRRRLKSFVVMKRVSTRARSAWEILRCQNQTAAAPGRRVICMYIL